MPSTCAEISDDYRDMIYAATRGEVETRRKAFIRKSSNATPSRTASRKSATSCSARAVPTSPMGINATSNADRAIA